MSVTDLANDLRLRLLNDDVLGNHQQIIFVAHSLGGLVVRTFLVRNREAIAQKVPMVFFYGTPIAGAAQANVASLFTQCLQVDDLRMIDANSFLQNQRVRVLGSNLLLTVGLLF
jgi:triacylglycerol esterase/lipase EstA (alpha/beta hydrolase family)